MASRLKDLSSHCFWLHDMMRTIVAIACLACLTVSVAAEDICGASAACDNESSNVEYIGCLSKLAEEQDKTLNQLFGQVKALTEEYDKVGTSAPKITPAIRQAQRAWITFRDAQCEAEYDMAQGGTAGGGYNANCLCTLTYHRNEDLRRFLRDYGQQ
jgi:uncharacterized protein YecT (DUF1311 family)